MKDCLEIEKILNKVIGDGVIGFFERSLNTSVQEVRVFTPVYVKQTKSQDFVN